MAYSYTPMYYTSLHDSITSICKSILPFSFKKQRLPAILAAEQRLSKQQSDNLKWQQDSFHQILKLIGLFKEGILPETEVCAFRSHLLDTLIASPVDHEQPVILRDKLIFLQELLYAKCISEEQYHASKRPLLQRLAVQGAEIEARDVIAGTNKETYDEEWSAIDLKDERCLLSKDSLNSSKVVKQGPVKKQIKGAKSIFSFRSSHRNGKSKEEKGFHNPGSEHFGHIHQNIPSSATKEHGIKSQSISMSESMPPASLMVQKQSGSDRTTRKPFRTLFQREQRERHGNGGDFGHGVEERGSKSEKKQLGLDGLKNRKKNDSDDETTPLSLGEKSDCGSYPGQLAESPVGEGLHTKQIKKKLFSNASLEVAGDNINKELSRIQTQHNAKNPNVQFPDNPIEAITTRLPVDKADLKRISPKYGNVVRKEFDEHIRGMENMQGVPREQQYNNSKGWTTFEDEDNHRPNLFGGKQQHNNSKGWATFDYEEENQHPNLFAREQQLDNSKGWTTFNDDGNHHPNLFAC